jgi:hypothetical protein
MTDKAPKELAEAYIEELKEKYMAGSCMYLAVALNRLFGYEMQACLETDSVGTYISHAYVKIPNGKILDIDGDYPESQNAYDGKGFGERVNGLTESDMKRYMGHEKNEDNAYERQVLEAMKVVRDYLLPTYQFSDKYEKQKQKQRTSEITL